MKKTVKELQAERNKVVKAWNEKMEPLREARRNGETVDWELWDKLEREMQIKVTKIDHELFKLGALH